MLGYEPAENRRHFFSAPQRVWHIPGASQMLAASMHGSLACRHGVARRKFMRRAWAGGGRLRGKLLLLSLPLCKLKKRALQQEQPPCPEERRHDTRSHFSERCMLWECQHISWDEVKPNHPLVPQATYPNVARTQDTGEGNYTRGHGRQGLPW